MNEYTIKELNSEIEAKEDFGNFAVYKMFKITSKTKPKIKGIIIQCILKKTIVIDAKNNKYDTTKKINKLTSNNVKYSNDYYFEIFNVNKKGISKQGDRFQNGSLTKYDNHDEPHTYDKLDPNYDIYKTRGEIKVIGINCFISEDNEYYDSILNGIRWNSDINTPANGLPFINYTDGLYDYIFEKTDSNILVHYVNVSWNFEKPKSKVSSEYFSFNNYLELNNYISGGKLKK